MGWVEVWLLARNVGWACFSVLFCLLAVWAVAPLWFFRGGAARFFSVPLGLGLLYSLVVAFLPFGNNTYLSKKKKKIRIKSAPK